MSKKMEILCGDEQIDEIVKELEADSEEMKDNVMSTINAVTPIFAVSLVTNDGKEMHFANFYGTTMYDLQALSQEEVEAKVQENDANIYEMIGKLEEKIKEGNFKKLSGDLLVKIKWAQFGGYMHEEMAKMDDWLACKSVDRAFSLFKSAYKNACRTKQEINEEKRKERERLKKSAEKVADLLFD